MRDDVLKDAGRSGTAVPAEPPAGGPPPSPRPAGPPRWLRPVAAAVLAALLVVVAVVAGVQRGRPELADRTENVGRVTPLPGLTTTDVQTQRLVAARDGLSGVYGAVGTYGGSRDCSVALRLLGPSGSTVAARQQPCATLQDSIVLPLLTFPAQAHSAGRAYVLQVSLAPGTWTQSVSLWGGPPPAGEPPAAVDGVPGTLSAAVFTTYGGRLSFFQRLPTVLHRIALVAPWWGQPALVVLWVLLLGGLVVGMVLAPRRAFPLLLVLALVRGLLWSVLLPPLEGPDEAAHVAYGQFMAVEDAVPRRGSPLDGLFGYSPQLLALIAGGHQTASAPTDRIGYDRSDVARLEDDVRAASPRAGGSGPAAGYPPLYYGALAVAYDLTPGTLVDRTFSMRLVSVLLGVLSAGLAFAALRRLLPRWPTCAAVLTAAVVLQPMVSQQFAVVNNDAVVVTAGAAALALAVHVALRGSTVRLMLLAGVVLGVALLGKPFGAAVALPLALAWLFALWRDRERRFGRVRRETPPPAAGVLLTYGAWLVVARLGHYPSTAQGIAPHDGPGRGWRDFVHLQIRGAPSPLRTQSSVHLWGDFSSLDTPLPTYVSDVVWFTLVGLAVATLVWGALTAVDLVRARLRGGPLVRPAGRELVAGTAVTLTLVLATWFVLWAAGYWYFRSTGGTDLLQGRYALLCLPALLALPVLYLRRFVPRLPPAVPVAVLLVAMWTLQVVSVGVVATRFYG